MALCLLMWFVSVVCSILGVEYPALYTIDGKISFYLYIRFCVYLG